MIDRYFINASDDQVSITGTLTIEEMFDYLNFFNKKGFGFVRTEDCFHLNKSELHDDVDEEEEDEENWENLFEEECAKTHELTKKVKDLTNLIKEIIADKVKANSLQNESENGMA